jgi:hypothetical protein
VVVGAPVVVTAEDIGNDVVTASEAVSEVKDTDVNGEADNNDVSGSEDADPVEDIRAVEDINVVGGEVVETRLADGEKLLQTRTVEGAGLWDALPLGCGSGALAANRTEGV